jgi:hypothetical protein
VATSAKKKKSGEENESRRKSMSKAASRLAQPIFEISAAKPPAYRSISRKMKSVAKAVVAKKKCVKAKKMRRIGGV